MNDDNHKQGARAKKEPKHTAQNYNENRFNRSDRMRRLNKIETHFVSETVKNIPHKNNFHIDIPCGSGRLSNALSEFGKHNYLGIDLSEDMLSEAQRTHPELKYLLGNVFEIPANSNTADIVLCMRLLHHFDLPEKRIQILRELARVSKKWVAVSFYRNECFRNISKRLRGRPVAGKPIAVKTFFAEAAEVELVKRKIVCGWLTGSAQTLVLLEKTT